LHQNNRDVMTTRTLSNDLRVDVVLWFDIYLELFYIPDDINTSHTSIIDATYI
jgi:hypothetical protein